METLIITPSGQVAVPPWSDDELPRAYLVPEPRVEADASAPGDLEADALGTLLWAEVAAQRG
jgi:hypothetical protein